MKLNIYILATCIALLANITFAQITIPETDFQVWNETTIQIPLIKEKSSNGKEVDRLTGLIIGVLRLGQNRLAPVDERIGGGFEWRLDDHFSLSPTYLYIAGQPGRNRSEFEHRLRFDVNFQKKWKHFSIKDRNRVEYRFRNSRVNTVRYRNKFTFTVPVKKDGKEIFAPFVADEPYFDFTLDEWSRNDVQVGVGRKLSSNTSGEFFYIWRHNRRGLPQDIHAVGVNLKIRID